MNAKDIRAATIMLVAVVAGVLIGFLLDCICSVRRFYRELPAHGKPLRAASITIKGNGYLIGGIIGCIVGLWLLR